MFPYSFNHRSLCKNVIFIVICHVKLAWVIGSFNRDRESMGGRHREPCWMGSFVSEWAGPSTFSLGHCLQSCKLPSSSERSPFFSSQELLQVSDEWTLCGAWAHTHPLVTSSSDLFLWLTAFCTHFFSNHQGQVFLFHLPWIARNLTFSKPLIKQFY